MSKRLVREKTVLVTGGSRGIGRAIAERLATDGAALVAVTYNVNANAAKETVAIIETAGSRGVAIQAALEDVANIEALFGQLDGELAGEKLDILVNCAGNPAWDSLRTATPATFDAIFAVHTRAPFFVTQAATARLADGGRVINVSSGVSKRPTPQLPVYAMAKAAIDAFTRALAIELGPRAITVNAVAPGWTATDINTDVRKNAKLVAQIEARTPLGRFGQPSDIAAVVAFLASPNAGWVTGQYIEASGGYGL
jgi:3-oxoacyl-[acyl-carrier protein] reductase